MAPATNPMVAGRPRKTRRPAARRSAFEWKLDLERCTCTDGALDGDHPAERFDAVSQPDEAGTVRVGAADAVVGDPRRAAPARSPPRVRGRPTPARAWPHSPTPRRRRSTSPPRPVPAVADRRAHRARRRSGTGGRASSTPARGHLVRVSPDGCHAPSPAARIARRPTRRPRGTMRHRAREAPAAHQPARCEARARGRRVAAAPRRAGRARSRASS